MSSFLVRYAADNETQTSLKEPNGYLTYACPVAFASVGRLWPDALEECAIASIAIGRLNVTALAILTNHSSNGTRPAHQAFPVHKILCGAYALKDVRQQSLLVDDGTLPTGTS